MDDLHRHFGSRRLWDKYDVPKCPIVSVIEVWGRDEPTMPDDADFAEKDSGVAAAATTATVAEPRHVSSMYLDNWLEEPATKYIAGDAHTRLLRLVLVGSDRPVGSGLNLTTSLSTPSPRCSPSTRDLDRLLEAWGLGAGYDYAMSCAAGVSALPPSPRRPHGDRTPARIFTAAYHPKLAAAWSWSRAGADGTLAVVFAEGEERPALLAALQSRWDARLVAHAMFPAFLCSLMLGQALDGTLEDIKTAVREVEERTGYHRFSTRRQRRPAAGELSSLSANMSGCAAKLANGTRKLKVVEALHEFVLRHTDGDADADNDEKTRAPPARDRDDWRWRRPETDTAFHAPASTPNTTFIGGAPLLRHHIELLGHRGAMQGVETAYVLQRVQVQITALLHLIAQQDNAIAFETASATRSIAKDSLQDSSSMKMLALVAMFFLPGSFVAALFSTPLFDWDGARAAATPSMAVGTRPQFALFWAVTVPLTAVTFVLYGVWIAAQKKRMKRRLKLGDA